MPDRPFYRGMNFGFNAPAGYYASALARERLERMRAANVEWVCLIVTVYQEHFHSYRQFADYQYSPQEKELREIIAFAHDLGLKVKLRPMLQTLSGEHRNMIWFPPDGDHTPPHEPANHWAKWFKGLRWRVLYYARLAAETGCEMYGLDSELDFAVLGRWNVDSFSGYWKEILQETRAIYDGHINYNAMHATPNLAALKKPGHWYHELDSFSLSYYPGTSHERSVSADDLCARFQPWIKDVFNPLIAELEKSGVAFFFGETGCRSSTDDQRALGDVGETPVYDPDRQANYVEAIMRTFAPQPWWQGVFWWKWDEHSDRPFFNDDPAGEKGFRFEDKPARDVMSAWYQKPLEQI